MNQLSAKSATIQWERPACHVDHYRLEYKTDKGKPVIGNIPDTESSRALTGLIPGTKYNVSLCCIRHKTESEKCTFTFTTAPDVPVIEPQPGSTSILLSWSQFKGNADSFEITCQNQDNEEEKQSVKLHGEMRKHTFKDLSENSKYAGEIWVNLESHRSKPYEWESLTSSKPAAGSQPIATVARSEGYISFSLKLVQKESKAPEGAVSGASDSVCLVVTAISARDLQIIGQTSKSNNYCSGFVYPEGDKKALKTKTSTGCNPTWKGAMQFHAPSVEALRNKCLQLNVMEKYRFEKDVSVGGIRLNMGTGKHNGYSVDWMDSTDQEQEIWQSLLDSTPGTEIPAELPIRSLDS
ncbi:synaptotagmin-like protein 2 [Lingula anatina]|uniref:Synaptotagmin-like protein 2 n=1 Tax=Lingula anatina TaxID=7574 RepID=A0A1S3IDT2_LINAN|nr:synaptotagmin-like protein 2 [Lingula anatina]|eukprot:XP_013395609.1 synaptotagmin-like protein 2 [Lingula anatina]